MADKKNEQDIQKSVEDTVNQILSIESKPENGGTTQLLADPTTDTSKSGAAADFPTRGGDISSGSPESVAANGGHDKIKNDSPLSKEQDMMGAKKKVDEAKKALAAAEAELDKVSKALPDEKDEKKESKKEEAKESASEEKKEAEKGSKMKKSLEELSTHLDAEELDLIKTWREECEKESMAKSQTAGVPVTQLSDLQEVLKKAIADGTADLKKAIDDKDTLIKSLNDKIEKMASQPAYDRRSISTLETLEKAGSGSNELKKSQVLDTMLAMQVAGKGVTSQHIAEFEATNNISDPVVRGIVFRELKLN